MQHRHEMQRLSFGMPDGIIGFIISGMDEHETAAVQFVRK